MNNKIIYRNSVQSVNDKNIDPVSESTFWSLMFNLPGLMSRPKLILKIINTKANR
jgi:hypothetical protein